MKMEKKKRKKKKKKEEEVLSMDVNGVFAASYHSFRLLTKVNTLKENIHFKIFYAIRSTVRKMDD